MIILALVLTSALTAHHDRVSLIHVRNKISITKATHAGRPFAAQTARAHGASVDGTKALGGWSEQGSFRPCYDRAFPTDALLGAGMFNAREPGAYFLPRDALGELPSHLQVARSYLIYNLQSPQRTFSRPSSPGSNTSKWRSLHVKLAVPSRAISLSSSSSGCSSISGVFYFKTVRSCTRNILHVVCSGFPHSIRPHFVTSPPPRRPSSLALKRRLVMC